MGDSNQHAWAAAPPGTEYAGPWIRLGALVIDCALLFLLWMAVWLVGGFLVVVAFMSRLDESSLDVIDSRAGIVVASVAASLVSWVWFTAWQASRGWTPGMKLLKLHVLGTDGRAEPSVAAAAIRNLPTTVAGFLSTGDLTGIVGVDIALGVVSLGICVALGVTIGKDQMRRGFHDRWARTLVVRRVPHVPAAWPQP